MRSTVRLRLFSCVIFIKRYVVHIIIGGNVENFWEQVNYLSGPSKCLINMQLISLNDKHFSRSLKLTVQEFLLQLLVAVLYNLLYIDMCMH